MRKDYGGTAMKEVEHSVVDPLKSEPKFMNAVSECICIGAVQLVSKGSQSLNPFKTLFSGLLLKIFYPLDHRNRPIIVFVEYDSHSSATVRPPPFLSMILGERSSLDQKILLGYA